MNTDIEAVKKFWDRKPCNIGHSSEPILTKEYFDEVEKKKFFVESHIPSFTQFEEWRGKKVLEIGCGIGTTAINFVRNGAVYTGVELSQVSLDITKKRFDVYGYKGEFFNGNAENLQQFLPIRPYDLIYSFGVIHHSPSPDKIINEIEKYMNSTSTLKIMLYAKNSWKKIMIDEGLDQYEAQSECPVAYTYDYYDVKSLLKNFDITEFNQTHIFPYKIEEYKKNVYVKQPWFASMPDDMFRALENRLGWHLLITAKLK